MANGFISPLKKGTASEPNRPGAADTTLPRGACTLFPHARPNNFVTYVNGHLADFGLSQHHARFSASIHPPRTRSGGVRRVTVTQIGPQMPKPER